MIQLFRIGRIGRLPPVRLQPYPKRLPVRRMPEQRRCVDIAVFIGSHFDLYIRSRLRPPVDNGKCRLIAPVSGAEGDLAVFQTYAPIYHAVPVVIGDIHSVSLTDPYAFADALRIGRPILSDTMDIRGPSYSVLICPVPCVCIEFQIVKALRPAVAFKPVVGIFIAVPLSIPPCRIIPINRGISTLILAVPDMQVSPQLKDIHRIINGTQRFPVIIDVPVVGIKLVLAHHIAVGSVVGQQQCCWRCKN